MSYFTCPDCGGPTGQSIRGYQVCMYCEWWTYRRARKRHYQDLDKTIYKNLWHGWRRMKRFPQDRGLVGYFRDIKQRKPNLFAGFIHDLRTNR